ncbi:MAG: terpene cyclase/mutase family protein [Deltaproteobacteria bacterium]|nr:terpene cyclase/mutase family protein [Deltaproteobacteria bacterium]
MLVQLSSCGRSPRAPGVATARVEEGGSESGREGRPVSVASPSPEPTEEGRRFAVPPPDRHPAEPVSAEADKGLRWLLAHQLPSGGWGQGDEAQGMGGGQALRDTANVADSSMALLAFVRAGSTPASGPHAGVVLRGVEYVVGQIEASDQASLFVSDVRGTRVQAKIGQYVDTFSALMLLNELRGTMPDEAANRRLHNARAKILAKMERNQQADGTWSSGGWAPALSEAMAARGLNRAAQAGDDVDRETIRRAERRAQTQFDAPSGGFRGDGSAGVGLYGGATSFSGMSEAAATRDARRPELERQAAAAPTPEGRQAARRELDEHREAQATLQSANQAIVERLADPQFVQGFGNNGGEEFLSYLLVSEALRAGSSEQWTTWNTRVTRLLAGVQNEDGSWTGHHCITGRTFCTATALLVLMAERAPLAATTRLRGA